MSYVCDGVKGNCRPLKIFSPLNALKVLDSNCIPPIDCNCPDHEKCSLGNGWEERKCSTCKPGGFLCQVSSMCIPERLRCNLEADCPDGEDERNCPSKYYVIDIT